MSFSTILATAISIIHLCIAESFCYERRPDPIPAHCASIIAHLPSTVHHAIDSPGQLLSNSHPFFPDATFRFRSCVVVLRASATNPGDRTSQSDPLAMRERGFFQSWHDLWSAAEDVQANCVENGLWGYNFRTDPDKARGRLYTLIYAYSEDERLYAYAAIAGQRMLIEQGGKYLQNMSGTNQPSTVDIVEPKLRTPLGRRLMISKGD